MLEAFDGEYELYGPLKLFIIKQEEFKGDY